MKISAASIQAIGMKPDNMANLQENYKENVKVVSVAINPPEGVENLAVGEATPPVIPTTETQVESVALEPHQRLLQLQKVVL